MAMKGGHGRLDAANFLSVLWFMGINPFYRELYGSRFCRMLCWCVVVVGIT